MSLKERLYRFRSFWIFPILAVVLLNLDIPSGTTARSERSGCGSSSSGILSWTLLEYGLHRFRLPRSASVEERRLRDIVNASHLGHHAVASRCNQNSGSSVLWDRRFCDPVRSALPRSPAAYFRLRVMLAGIWTGFLYYEVCPLPRAFQLVGIRIHWTAKASRISIITSRTTSDAFGVTSPLWDYVFRTR